MQAQFEVKYLEVKWYDKDTVLSVKESFIPLKIDFETERLHFTCNTVIYPKLDSIKHGRLAFRYLNGGNPPPFFEAIDGTRFPLKQIIDNETGKEWWVEANFWISDINNWDTKLNRTAGKALVMLGAQICELNIGISGFTELQLERYLSDFKNDLWELILDESSYISGKAKKTNEGSVGEESLQIVSDLLSHAQKILKNPKSELREIQMLMPRKMVKPVARTFMELSTKGDSRFLNSRATTPSYNVPENRYVLFALERVYKIVRQLTKISRSKSSRFASASEKLNERNDSFKNYRVIDKDLVRKDLERIKSSYNLENLNIALKQRLQGISLSNVKRDTLYVKINVSPRDRNTFLIDVKTQKTDNWVVFNQDGKQSYLHIPEGLESSIFELFDVGFEYKIEGELTVQAGTKGPIQWKRYTLLKLSDISIVDAPELKKKFQIDLQKAKELLEQNWKKPLTANELAEQRKEKLSVENRLKYYEDLGKKTKLVGDHLEPKLIKFQTVTKELRAMGIKPSPTFPNSMTFVQNLNYQGIHSGYQYLRSLTNLSDDDLLVSLERVDEIGLINMPILYERWCLLQIIKVLIQQYNYFPELDWKRKLVKMASSKQDGETLRFVNAHVKRDIELSYEPRLRNGRTPDFVLDVHVEQKNGTRITKRFVMDAKYYFFGSAGKDDGISKVIQHLYVEKDYSENGKNAVFILHPDFDAIPERVSPQDWGITSYLGELRMFSWEDTIARKLYHQYGAVCVNPANTLNYLDEIQRLIGMFLQFGVENNQLEKDEDDDIKSVNFCLACGSADLTQIQKSSANFNSRSQWYTCNDCKHFTTYNHCFKCNTRLIKNGDYWTYHSQMPLAPLNIKCPACESLL